MRKLIENLWVRHGFLVAGILLLAVAVSACSPVSPWQKGNLAKRHMSFDPDPLEAKVRAHTQESKEGSAGGYGPGGGGCGCT